MKQYTTLEKIRLITPKCVWALLAFGYMIGLYIGVHIMAIYVLYKLIKGA